jgi:hypothetical protein
MLKVDGIFNRDMQPSERLIRTFPQMEPVLDNPAISHAFQIHERSAVWWKRVHGLLGRTALLYLLIGMAFFDYELTLRPLYLVTRIAALAAAVLAGTGVACQLAMIFVKTKERWLVERFAAERLRCLKFHAFALVAQSETSAELAISVAQFTKEKLARLDQQLLGGRAALIAFSPSELSVSIKAKVARHNEQLVREAHEAYLSTRVEIQVQHFEAQCALSNKRAGSWTFLSEIAFALGGTLAFIQICNAIWNGFGRVESRSGAWLAFFALLLFIGSAVLAIYQRGSSHTPDAERYRHYARELRSLKMWTQPIRAEDFLHLVEQTEQIESHELFDFCRDTARSSYIF